MSEDKPSTSFTAAIASFIFAALLGIGAFYLGWGLLDTGEHLSRARMVPGGRGGLGLGILTLLCIGMGGGALLFGWIGFRCLVDGARNSTRSRKELEEEQQYWDSFPAPKD